MEYPGMKPSSSSSWFSLSKLIDGVCALGDATFLRRFLGKGKKGKAAKQPPRRLPLQVEALEQRWMPATGTSAVGAFSTGTATTGGITSGPDNQVWTTFNGGNGGVASIATANGNITYHASPSANSNYNDITTGGDGNLWFTLGTYSPNSSACALYGILAPFGRETSAAIRPHRAVPPTGGTRPRDASAVPQSGLI
jgi:hypothetical protein